MASGRGAWFDHIGEALFLALAAWIFLSGAVVGGNPFPMAGLVLAIGVTLFLARWLTRWHPAVVPAAVAAGVAGLVIVSGPDSVHRLFGPLGYSNANAALYVIGVGAAGMVIVRVAVWWIQVPFMLIGLGLAVLPWFLDALAAALATIVIVGTLLVLLATARGTATLIRLAAAVAFGAIAVTGLIGILYSGSGEGEGAWLITERRLVLWSEAADLATVYPAFGVGPGRFPEESRTALTDRDAQWAHHEPLEVGAEAGLPAFVLVIVTIMWVFAWVQRGSGRRGAALAGVVLSLGVVQASIDYVWHYPAVPIALAAVAGAGASAGAQRSFLRPPAREHVEEELPPVL